MKKINLPDYSVVIATLGGSTLKKTINCINSSSVIPKEILICIPFDEKENVDQLEGDNIKILITKARGQVAQRAEGFENATGVFVLQMDDDVVFDTIAIEEMMILLMQLGQKYVVGPVFCDEINQKPIALKPIEILSFTV